MSEDLIIREEDNSIVLNLIPNELILKTDTYYYAIDTGLRENDESVGKIKENIKNLIANWIVKIKNLEIKQVAYLPFDFSDQYIGCLRIRKENTSCIISYGYTSNYQGYSLSPSESNTFSLNENEFKVTKKEKEVTYDAFLQTIERILKEL